MYLTDHIAERRLLTIKRRAEASCADMPQSQIPLRLDKVPARRTDWSRDVVEPIDDPQRRSRRADVSGELFLRRGGSFNHHVDVHNVSTGGCRVDLVERCDVEERLVARLPELEPLGARVCWVQGTKAGLEFANPIHPSVFDALLARLSGTEAAIGPA